MVVWVGAAGQAGSSSWGRKEPEVGLFGCRAPPSGAGRTQRRARRSRGQGKEGQVGKRSCLRNHGVWGACVWAFLSESGSTHQCSMDVGSHLW